MTNEQINRAIAEACGWTEIHDSGPCHHHKLWGYPPELPGQCGNAYNYIPDYCNDLNAMHEAEGTLGKSLYRMEAQLKRMAGAVCFHATASQRAEAFLRTVGKWEEVQR
jgi:hypothetical protein